jgi:hypothetical protein
VSGALLFAPLLTTQNQTSFIVIVHEAAHNRERGSQQILDVCACAIAGAEPDHLRWRTQNNASFLEIRVFGNDYEVVGFGVIPNRCVVRTT